MTTPASETPPGQFDADLIVIGAGAAGLATAIFTARAAPHCHIVCLDGARRIGAKILVSGGSRCNVTNREVTERDFWGGSSRFVRNVLRAFPAVRAVEFFDELGVALHEEEDGKLFPDTNSSRTVLNALLREIERLRIPLLTGHRVTELHKDAHGFVVAVAGRPSMRARTVALCTGGRSLPKTGSDGFGYELARRLGHSCVDTVPALAPLIVKGWDTLAGVAHAAAMTLRIDTRDVMKLGGPLLWTHFGVSGPLALNMSRHWHRAQESGSPCALTVNLCPGESFETLDNWLREQGQLRPRVRVTNILATRLPAAVAERWVSDAGIAADATMAHLPRDARHSLIRALIETPLPVQGSRGFGYAEVTAGGVPLEEVDSATMESRRCPNLFLSGEILDVDGRLGGFNFQWAWSSGWVTGQAIARVTG